ncbi:hypothetical protein CDAR_244771 [Caerostris darwini]|uniref:Uncharacterized protein n=1 Tax=Caerostris darwini TaxID=1538125 RepID=A0AAV4ML46_9ARAC|nr:hypothetical protein CDAR_244771 [Caerostris darwini]
MDDGCPKNDVCMNDIQRYVLNDIQIYKGDYKNDTWIMNVQRMMYVRNIQRYKDDIRDIYMDDGCPKNDVCMNDIQIYTRMMTMDDTWIMNSKE